LAESASGFGSRAAKESGGTKRGNVTRTFEGGLSESGSGSSAGRSDATFFGGDAPRGSFDFGLTLDVLAEIGKEATDCATQECATNAAGHTQRSAETGAGKGTSYASCGGGKRTCDGFGSCAGNIADALAF
jgi:hypothetical protein